MNRSRDELDPDDNNKIGYHSRLFHIIYFDIYIIINPQFHQALFIQPMFQYD